jgi:PAS domain S-box-containing protein
MSANVSADLSILEALFEASPIGMAVHDRQHRFLCVNKALATINELPVASHIGKRLSEIRPSVAPIVEPILEGVLTTGNAVMDVRIADPAASDPRDERQWIGSFVPVTLGGAQAVAVFVSDNTAQHRAEHALRASDELFHQIAENIDAVLYLASPDSWNVLYLNPAFERVWGISVESAQANSSLWMEAIHPEDRQRVSDAVQANRTGFSAEYRVVRPDGNVRWISDRSFPVYDANGTFIRIAGVASDVTVAKHMEAQLLQSQRLESIGRLAGGVAHDFNNLLTVILSHATFAKEMLGTADEDLSAIEQAGERAADLTKQLLAFARRQVIEPRVMDVNVLTTNIDKMLRRLIGEDVELVTLLEPELWLVKVDSSQLEQVLVNLAVNARDAMPSGGKLTIETGNVVLDAGYVSRHSGVLAGEYVMIAVSDTGEGIDPATLPMIFEPFFSTKPRGQGTGLGLATCYGIVTQAGGHILAYSEPRHGASFKVYLPRAKGAVTRLAAPATPGASRGWETVLVVEDNASVRAIAARTLRELGFHVLEATNGAEALRVAAGFEETIHLLLTDVVMPHMGGRELAAKLKEARPEIRVMYTSGYTQNAIGHDGVLAEGLNFLPKPYVPGKLATKVRETLDNV